MKHFVTHFPILSHTKLLLLFLFKIIFLDLYNNFWVWPQNMRKLIKALLVSSSSNFLWILPPCYHSGKCWNPRHKHRNGLVSLWSPLSRRDFWSLRLSTRGHYGFHICLLHRKFLRLPFRCMPVLCLGVFLFPDGEVALLLRRAFLATLWTHNQLFMLTGYFCDQDSGLWLLVSLSTSRARSLYHLSSLFQRNI